MSKTLWQRYDGIRVKAANALIEAEYSEDFTEEAHKVSRLIISGVQPDDTELYPFYIFSMEDLKNYLRYDSPTESDWDWEMFSEYLSEIAECLIREPIKIWTNDRKIARHVSFISSWEIHFEKQIVKFEISQGLVPYLVQLKSDFTNYLLGNISRLDKAHSIRIYELLSQYRRIGKRTFEVEDLKRKLGYDDELCRPLEMTKPDALLKNHGFLGWDLVQAQQEVKVCTDLCFEMEEHEREQTVTELTFHIYPNTPHKPLSIQR